MIYIFYTIPFWVFGAIFLIGYGIWEAYGSIISTVLSICIFGFIAAMILMGIFFIIVDIYRIIKKDPYDDPFWKLFLGIIGWTLWCLPFIWFLRVLAIEGK